MNIESVKEIIRKTPIIGSLTVRLAKAIGYRKKRKPYVFKRINLLHTATEKELQLAQITNLLDYSKTSGNDYAATNFPAGYHTLNILGQEIKGRRNPSKRFEIIPYDFTNKSVLDIGSNQGGMLFEIKDKIRWGVGVDYDPRMINVSSKIKAAENLNNMQFFQFNLEQDPLKLLNDLMPEKRVDIVFLLAVCRWINNWQEVISFITTISNTLLIETNGSKTEQNAQIEYFKSLYESTEELSTTSDDDPERSDRRLFICHTPKK